MAGVGDGFVLNACENWGVGTSNSLRSNRIFPESLSTATANSSLPSGVAVVSHSWRPRMTGDDHARPWMGVFQRTFWVSLQVIGRPMAVDTPSPSGPRNCGH